jgi:hypothetical protein
MTDTGSVAAIYAVTIDKVSHFSFCTCWWPYSSYLAIIHHSYSYIEVDC